MAGSIHPPLLSRLIAVLVISALCGCRGGSYVPGFVGSWELGDQTLTFTADGHVHDDSPNAVEQVSLQPHREGTWSLKGRGQMISINYGPGRGSVDYHWELSNDGDELTLFSDPFLNVPLPRLRYKRRSQAAPAAHGSLAS